MEKGTAINHEEQGYRRRRVQRMKKLIVGTVIVLILVPTICCIGLLLKVRQLEKQIKNLQLSRLNIEESLVDFDTAFSATVEYATDVLSEDVVFYQSEDWNSIEENAENGELTYEEQLDKTIEKGKVYLTFDDGPGPHTDELLDVLAEYDIKATFFVIGRKDECLDAAIETNKFRQYTSNAVKGMLKYSPSKKTEQGRDYKFNVEGNQTPYYYEIETSLEENFSRDTAKKVVRDMIAKADKTSADIDSAMINTVVDYEPVFDVNDSFEDVMAEFTAKVLPTLAN